MMNYLADILLSLLDLMEAEGRALRQGIVKAAVSLALILVAAVLLLGALTWLTWSMFLGLAATALGSAVAALLTGLATLVLAGIVLAFAKAAGR